MLKVTVEYVPKENLLPGVRLVATWEGKELQHAAIEPKWHMLLGSVFMNLPDNRGWALTGNRQLQPTANGFRAVAMVRCLESNLAEVRQVMERAAREA